MKRDLILLIKNLWRFHQHKNQKVFFFKKSEAGMIYCIEILNAVIHFFKKNIWISPERKVKAFCSLKILV